MNKKLMFILATVIPVFVILLFSTAIVFSQPVKQEATRLSLSTNEIDILANQGPGSYHAEDSVWVYIITNEEKWVLHIHTDGLTNVSGYDTYIWPSELFIATGSKAAIFEPLTNGLYLTGSGDASVEVFIRTELSWEHAAGAYRGKLWFDFAVLN